VFRIAQAAKLIGVHPNTLRRWEREGKLKPARTLGGERRYTTEEINKLRSEMGLPPIDGRALPP
jgi:putative resolvase